MKKIIKYIMGILGVAGVAFLYYYITLPAINIHSQKFWSFIFFAIVLMMVFYVVRKINRDAAVEMNARRIHVDWKAMKPLKAMFILLMAVVVVFLAGSILSSPFVNAKKYQQLLAIEEREFVKDIKEVDYNTIPLLDKNSSMLLGNRKMGSLVDLVSQFEVSVDYTQINYQDRPVRVTPLVYASPIKWLTNQKNGIPAYIMIDMATQNTECIRLEKGIRYSKSEFFNRNLYRHLRFRYPTYIFDNQISFEIDDEGTPYWVCPVRKYNIGLFGGQTIGRVVLCNAITGETTDYAIEDVPQWIDRAYSAELLISLYNYSGTLKHGYWNSVLGQKDCLRTTNGYNYIALEDDVWVYTGVTSLSGDQSNVGFVLMNQRTMETRFYTVEGATEDSAMSSAEGQVQNLGYRATFPLLLNIANEPTYFMALKDDAGLVKKYAMVNVQKYQWVAIGDTVKECEKAYVHLLNTNGISKVEADKNKTIAGKITTMAPIVLEGMTHYYVCIENSDLIFDFDMSNADMISIVKYKEGDHIRFQYTEGYDLSTVVKIQT